LHILAINFVHTEIATQRLQTYSKKLLGSFNPTLGQIWTNPSHWVTFFNYIFNPTFGFVHFWPKVGL